MAIKTRTNKSILSTLNFVKVAKPSSGMSAEAVDPVEQRRKNFTAACDIQIKLVDNPDLEVPTTTYKDGKKVEGTRRPRPWFFEVEDKWFLSTKYGTRDLFDGEARTIEAGKKKSDVKVALAALIEACGNGELDERMAKASERKMKDKTAA